MAAINDESLRELSSPEESKRNSSANYPKLDISNIPQNNNGQGQETIIDEEDH